jgi:hypothetical protein
MEQKQNLIYAVTMLSLFLSTPQLKAEQFIGEDGTMKTMSSQDAKKVCYETYVPEFKRPDFNIWGFEKDRAERKKNNLVVDTQLDDCITQVDKAVAAQKNMPPEPGPQPIFNCVQDNKYEACKAEYDAKKAAWQANQNARDMYLNQNPNMYSIVALSASDLLKNIAVKQKETSDKMNKTSGVLSNTSNVLTRAGTLLMLIPEPISQITGVGMIASGIVLSIISNKMSKQASQLAADANMSCEQLNKIVTKQVNCNSLTATTQTAQLIKLGDNSKTSISNLATFIEQNIDKLTGQCKKDAAPECAAIVKMAPKDCYKKGGACLASGQTAGLKTTADGKVVATVNGKERTFGLEDFQTEASMIKAGFTAAQAAQFMKNANDPNGILAQNGLNIKGELKNLNNSSDYKAVASSYSSGYSSTSATKEAIPFKKDEFVPSAEVQALARGPAANGTETPTVDYHGDKIGVNKDNLFNMVNRRYNLKSQQNIFIGE